MKLSILFLYSARANFLFARITDLLHGFQNQGLRGREMCAHQLFRARGVVVFERVKDFEMVLVRGATFCLVVIIINSVQRVAFEQTFGNADEMAIAGDVKDLGVKLLIEFNQLLHLLPARVGLMENGEKLLIDAAQRVQFGGCDFFCGEPRGVSFQQNAQVVQFREFVGRDRADARALLCFKFDEPFGFEAAQGFAHRRAADAQFLREGFFDEALIGLDGALYNRRAQIVGDLLADGLGGKTRSGRWQEFLPVLVENILYAQLRLCQPEIRETFVGLAT